MKWTLIRAIGNLKILSKVSYLFLLFIPILASTWFVVPQILNGNVSRISRLVDDLNRNSIPESLLNQQITTQSDSLSYFYLEQIVIGTKKKVESELSSITYPKFNSYTLPIVWVYSYLAALSFLIAHLIYESMVPDIIKDNKCIELIKSRKLDYLSSPNSKLIESYKLDLEEINKSHEIDNLGPRPVDDNQRRNWDLNLVEISTEKSYEYNNKKNKLAIILSFIFFVVSIFFTFFFF